MLDNNTDLIGRQRFKLSNNSFINMTANANLNNMFTTDNTLIFRIGELKNNEVIYSKGHPTNPAQGSWSIINDNRYLKIILHETNGINSLVFKSTQQIFNTNRRITVAIVFYDATSNVELFVNSLPEVVALDVSQGHYRTNINQFTGLRVTSDNISVGRGTGQIYGEFGLYYDLCESRTLTQSEINVYYQPLIDSRTLPSVGKVLFCTDRDYTNFSVTTLWEMNDDGTNQIYRDSHTSGAANPEWSIANPTDFSYNVSNIGVFHRSGTKYTFNNSGVYHTSHSADGLRLYYGNGSSTMKYLAFSQLPSYPDNNVGGNLNSYATFRVVCHPINPDKLLLLRYATYGVSDIIEYSITPQTFITIWSNPYTNNAVGDHLSQIETLKYSKDGTKCGFTVMYRRANNNVLEDRRAYIVDVSPVPGANLQLLGQNYYFGDFSPDGTEVLLFRELSGPGYSNKLHIVRRNLLTNVETQLTTGNHNNYYVSWKA